MLRRLLLCALAPAFALAFASAALADGPAGPPLSQGGNGVLAPGGSVRYVAVGTGQDTTIEAIRTSDGSVLRFTTYPGMWGIPTVTADGTVGGLSADGSTLVLADATATAGPLRKRSRFEVISAETFRPRATVTLSGDFSFDALSPDGGRLYLIQRVSERDLNRYVVRAYDLRTRSLLAGRIADRTQRGWVMSGWPVRRATSAGGRWVYTLYTRPGGTPFVHALDTVHGVAHCVGIPWAGDQYSLSTLRLVLRDGGRTLVLERRSGRPYLSIATATWRISRPAPHAGTNLQWWLLGAGLLGTVLALGVLARPVRRLATRPARAQAT